MGKYIIPFISGAAIPLVIISCISMLKIDSINIITALIIGFALLTITFIYNTYKSDDLGGTVKLFAPMVIGYLLMLFLYSMR